MPFTATLSDPDGMATDIKWQWWITTDNADSDTVFPNAVVDGTRTDWDKIDDAKTDTLQAGQ